MLSEAQWAAFEEFMANPDLKAVILCSETPFLGDTPEVTKEKINNIDFLRDHWTYNDEELIKLMDICFAWKEEHPCKRDIILVNLSFY